MAGRGPAPKANRQRRNVPARGEWMDLEPLDGPVLCELPDYHGGDDREDWFPSTREMWEAWRADPVTQTWSPADVAYALNTIRLLDGGAPPNEVRLRMDGLGLTPKGKRDLRWRIAAAPEGEVVELPQKRDRALRAV